jgi:hypothetical protein
MKRILFILFSFCALSSSAQKQIILYDNCEFAPLIEWGSARSQWQYFQGNVKPAGTGPLNSGTSKITVSDSFARNGTGSYRFQIVKDKTYGATGLTGTSRSELVWNIGSPVVNTNIRWAAASLLVPTWFADDITPEGVLFGAMPTPVDHPSPSQMYMFKGKWYLEGITVNDTGKITGKFLYDVGPVEKGVWVDWVLNRNFTQKDSGYVRLYKNGKLVVSHTGGNWVEKNHNAEMYLQVGLNKWPWNDSTGEGNGPSNVNDQRVVYIDEIKFGNATAKLEDFTVVPDSLTNIPPVIDAPSSFTVLLPKDYATLTVAARDTDGKVASNVWTQLSGDSKAFIVNATALSTTVRNLVPGTYKFRLSVKDNSGAISQKDVTVNVVMPANPEPSEIFLHDDCEDEPEVQPIEEWAQLPLSRWCFYTGHGNDVMNKSDLANITVSTAYAKKGKSSYKISLTKNPTYDPPSIRAELSWNQPASTVINWKWAAASILIPTTWVDDCTPVGVLFNTKASPDNYSTPFRLQIMKDRYTVAMANITKDGKVLGELNFDIGPVVKGIWSTWVLNRNFTQTDTGYIKLYKDGNLVWEYNGPNWLVGVGRAAEGYVHQGLYKWTWSDANGMNWGIPCYNGTIEAYYDEFRFGGPSAKLSDFMPADIPPVTTTPASSSLSSPGTPIVFNKTSGSITQSPIGVWGTTTTVSTAVSTGQRLPGNGFVEMAFADTISNSATIVFDTDSTELKANFTDNTAPNDLIWVNKKGKKIMIGDFINGKHITKEVGLVPGGSSLVKIKRMGTAFIVQLFATDTGWITIYTYEFQTPKEVWIKGAWETGNKMQYPILGK